MVEFSINLNQKGYGSIPKELREMWGQRLAVISNSTVGVIYKKGTDLEDIKISLEILLQDVEHRIMRDKRDKNKKLSEFEEGKERDREAERE